ncbi:MAG: hypothetical protein EPN91_00325 [Salinibacterium sp.]|nr:MAG: hypothetical protein EPN91_00325 [Salinibacterium sp.]
MSTERPNLEAAFGAPKAALPDRAAGAGAALGKRPPRSTEVDRETVGAQLATIEPPKPVTIERTPRAAPKVSRANSRGAVNNVAVYLESTLLARAKQELRQKDITYDTLAVLAFEHVTDEALAKHFSQDDPSDDTAMPLRAKRRRGEAGIQVQLRLDGNQRAWLDAKQASVGAPSRSALVAAAVRLYLLP